MLELKEFFGASLYIAISIMSVVLFGLDGIFFAMWGFFVFLTVMLLRKKNDRRQGIIWLFITMILLSLYIWTQWIV